MSRRNPYSKELPESALRYVLESLIPYTRANLNLAFKPNSFFDDLERIDKGRYSRSSMRNAYYRALREGLIEKNDDGSIRLTEKGESSLKPYEPESLNGSHILVVFDIPEGERYKRRMFRLLLRELKFRMIQQSVWLTDYECRNILAAEIDRLKLDDYVQIYEAVEL
ncbi:hypothetical protein CR956_00995 [Candidatus Saccharibacteria bacterium]|nr:MAG: hypothetical protein CR956_00995 [Candidatus Saccharibacteria bacterium]